MKSAPVPDGAKLVEGPDYEAEQSLQGLLSAYETIGFQATGLSRAIEVINKMVRLSSYLRFLLTAH